MIKNRCILIALCLCLSILTSGCIFHSDLKLLNSKIDNHLKPLRLNHTNSICFGSISMFFIQKIIACSDDDDTIIESLKGVDKINVAIYETDETMEHITAQCVDQVVKNFQSDGWELFIKVRDHDEMALLFYKQSMDNITSFSVVALSEEEVVLLEMDGDLKKIIQTAIQGQGKTVNSMVKTARSS